MTQDRGPSFPSARRESNDKGAMMIILQMTFFVLFTCTIMIGCSTYVTVNRLDPETLNKQGVRYECVRDVRVMKVGVQPEFRVYKKVGAACE